MDVCGKYVYTILNGLIVHLLIIRVFHVIISSFFFLINPSLYNVKVILSIYMLRQKN